jgi:hypothetical protein
MVSTALIMMTGLYNKLQPKNFYCLRTHEKEQDGMGILAGTGWEVWAYSHPILSGWLHLVVTNNDCLSPV